MDLDDAEHTTDGEALLAQFKELLGDLYMDANRLEFISELGVGELALVERGQYHPPSGGRAINVVVKGYSPHVIATPEDLHSMLEEARSIQRLQHKHLVKLHGLGCFHHQSPEELLGSMFMAEEFVGTMSLKALLRLQKRTKWRWLFSMTTAMRWASCIASALAALHAADPPYVHGDVKAINIFLTDTISQDSSVVKLGDLKPHRHVYDKAPSLLREHQAAQAMQQQSLRKVSLKDRSRKVAAKWQGAKPLGRKSIDVARAEWEAHTGNSSDSGSRGSIERRSIDFFGGSVSSISAASTPRASVSAAAAAAAALITPVPEDGAARVAPLPLTPFQAAQLLREEQQRQERVQEGQQKQKQRQEGMQQQPAEEPGQGPAQGQGQQHREQHHRQRGQEAEEAKDGTNTQRDVYQRQPQEVAPPTPPTSPPPPQQQQQQQQQLNGSEQHGIQEEGEAVLQGERALQPPPPLKLQPSGGNKQSSVAGLFADVRNTSVQRMSSYVIHPGSSRQFGIDATLSGALSGTASGGGVAGGSGGGGGGAGGVVGTPPASAAAGDGVEREGAAGGAAERPLGPNRLRSILRSNSSVEPDGGRAFSSNKTVHFEVARAEGVTSNRNWGLLYASPELLRKRELTPKVDVFAFGVLLYELLSRRLVAWTDDSEQAQFYERSVRGGTLNLKKHGDESLQLLAYAERVADGYRPPLSPLWPEPVVELVEGCWAADPADRPTMAAVSEALSAMSKDRKLIRQLEMQTPPHTPQVQSCACTIS